MTKILVADDESDLEILIKQKFRHKIRDQHYHFIFSANGKDALDQMRLHPDVEVVLSDINMPEMDGLTLLKQLTETYPSLKTVMVSAYGDMENIRTAMNRGAFDFVTKPVNFSDLEITIEKTIRHVSKLKQGIKLERELELAQSVQHKLLPQEKISQLGIDIMGYCKPSQNVGGDYFDFIKLSDNKIGIAIADVSGKGISAALYMTMVKGILLAYASDEISPKKVLIKLNKIIYQTIKRGSFVSLIYALLDFEKRELTYVRAGHHEPIHILASDEIQTTDKTSGLALGLTNQDHFNHSLIEKTVSLNVGDSIVFFTDGFTEAKNDTSDEFGVERFSMSLIKHRNKKEEKNWMDLVCAELKEFVGKAEQFDDMTMVVIQVS